MSPCSMHARPPERADHALIEECFNYSRPVMTYARNGPLSDVRRRNSPHSRSSAAYCSPCRFTLWQTSEQWHEPSPRKQTTNTKPKNPQTKTNNKKNTTQNNDQNNKGIRGAPRDALVADIAPAHMRGAAYGLCLVFVLNGALLGPLLAVVFLFWLVV